MTWVICVTAFDALTLCLSAEAGHLHRILWWSLRIAIRGLSWVSERSYRFWLDSRPKHPSRSPGNQHGWFDSTIQEKAYLDFDLNNSYKPLINQSFYDTVLDDFNNDCLPSIQNCSGLTGDDEDCGLADYDARSMLMLSFIPNSMKTSTYIIFEPV